MADKFAEESKERNTSPLPGTEEFRMQMDRSLSLYSEGLDKLIGSLRILEQMLDTLIRRSPLSEAYERFVKDSMAAEKNRPFHPSDTDNSGEDDSRKEEEEHVVEGEGKKEKEQETARQQAEERRILEELSEEETREDAPGKTVETQESSIDPEEYTPKRKGR